MPIEIRTCFTKHKITMFPRSIQSPPYWAGLDNRRAMNLLRFRSTGLLLDETPKQSQTGDITRLLRDANINRPGAKDDLYKAVWNQLRSAAGYHLARVPTDGVMQPTSLVNDAWMRLQKKCVDGFENRRHFFAVAQQVIHDVAVDEARRCAALKRGGNRKNIPIQDDLPDPSIAPHAFLDIDQALRALQEIDPEAAEVVRLWSHLNMTFAEIAELLECSDAQVKRHWRYAKAFLKQFIEKN